MKNKYSKFSILASTVFLAVFLLSGCDKNNVMENTQSQDKQIAEEDKKKNEEKNAQNDNPENQQGKPAEQNIPKENEIKNEDVKVATSEQKNCSIDLVKYCPSDSFTDPNRFKKFLKTYEENFSDSDYEKYKKKFTVQFNKCQEALKCK